jgi:hypothetical protein
MAVALLAIGMATYSCDDDDSVRFGDTDITGFRVRIGEGNYKQGTIKPGNLIEFKITPDFDTAQLNGLTSQFYISPYAVVKPTPDEPQDFSQDVHYVVTAQNGSSTDWTVKWTYGGKVPDGQGVDYLFKKWEAPMPAYKNKDFDGTGAVFKDYLIDSDFNIYNRRTGELTDLTLNVEGITFGSQWLLLNDDALNLLLYVRDGGIYRYTDVTKPPVKIADSGETSGGATKGSASGDIDREGYIYVNKPDGKGTVRVYKFENGSFAGSSNGIQTGRPDQDGTWRQLTFALGGGDNTPFYVVDTTPGSADVWYYTNPGATGSQVVGPYTGWDKKGDYGWSNNNLVAGNGVPFNGRWYGALAISGWGWIGIHLIDPGDNHAELIWNTFEGWTTNSNIWVAYSPGDDDNAYVYYSLGTSIQCYELTKYEK